MSASTAAVNPAPAPSTPAPARTPASQASTPNDHCFDHHLDAARQQHDSPRDPAAGEQASEQAVEAPSVHVVAAGAPSRTAADALLQQAPAKDKEATDAPALAVAMLALIGQAVPVPPLAAGAVHAATKAVRGTAGDTPALAPSALALLPGGAIPGQAAQAAPGHDLDAQALAPLLGKAAQLKDTPADGARPADTLAAMTAQPGAATATVPPHHLIVPSPAGTPAFAQELGEHIAWLGTQDVKQARVRLHPEDLGSMDIKVSLHHDRIDVSFAVQHPAAVHVVQQTLPQLDLLLAQHGLALGQADVGQRQHQGESGRGGDGVGAISELEAEPAIIANTPLASLGMLDTFA
jgi:flagellar hook-length control protein FliK